MRFSPDADQALRCFARFIQVLGAADVTNGNATRIVVNISAADTSRGRVGTLTIWTARDTPTGPRTTGFALVVGEDELAVRVLVDRSIVRSLNLFTCVGPLRPPIIGAKPRVTRREIGAF